MQVLESHTYYNKYGSRKKTVKFQGDYTDEELVEKLVHDAPYGHWMKFRCIDEENKIYQGEVHEYWD